VLRRLLQPLLLAVPIAALGGVRATPSGVVLNEVLYDPEGVDSGREFVELAAPPDADPEADLAGWVLETGNGARPGEWTVEWTGAVGDRLLGGLFVIGESGVEPPPDAVADLDLQNGPDACRLRGPAGERDVLGWGSLLDSALCEGEPAEDVASGEALARLPDGVDTGDNRRDFLAAEPTPGEFNAPDVCAVVEEASLPPAGLPPGEMWEFRWTVRNAGRSPWVGPLELRCAVHPGELLGLAWPEDSGDGGTPSLAPGERGTLALLGQPPPGCHLPISMPAAPGEPAPWPGLGEDLLFMEAYPRPREGEPEWLELRSVAAGVVDLAAFRLADAAGTSAPLAGVLQPAQFAVLTPDTAALLLAWGVGAEASFVEVSPWPALNHTAGTGEAAERVVLLAGDLEVAAASWAGGIGQGVSWERCSRYADPEDPASWQPSLSPAGGTPGSPNTRDGDRSLPPASVGVGLTVAPRVFRPAALETALIVLRPPRAAPASRILLFDSSGIPVRELESWRAAPDEHRALWDGRDEEGSPLPLGLYIVHAEAAGCRPVRASVVLVR
jgi:hypothetical protein